MTWSAGGTSPWDEPVRSGRTKGVLLGVLGVVILGALLFATWWVKQREPVDEATNCPVSGPRAIHVVLIDQSDPITPQQGLRVRQELARLRDTAAGERIDIFAAEGDAANVLSPVFSLCSPGQGKDANALYQNPERVQRRFEERFAAVLERTIDRLLQAQTRQSSPILESIKAAAVTAYGNVSPGAIPLRLTIISDMVQHSAANSHFKGQMDFGELARAPVWRSLQPNLKGAEVNIFYVLRPTARRPGGQPIQTRGHQLFWEHAIQASGGNLVSLETI
jgi:hypothetical protein